MCVPKTSNHIQINIRMPNPSQEPPASSKAPDQGLKDMDVLCTFKIKMESQNSDHVSIKDKWPYLNQDQDAKPQTWISSTFQSPKGGPKGHGYSLHLQYQEKATFWAEFSWCQSQNLGGGRKFCPSHLRECDLSTHSLLVKISKKKFDPLC